MSLPFGKFLFSRYPQAASDENYCDQNKDGWKKPLASGKFTLVIPVRTVFQSGTLPIAQCPVIRRHRHLPNLLDQRDAAHSLGVVYNIVYLLVKKI